MNTKDWFSLAVRILGLVFLYNALISLPLSLGMAIAGGQAGLITIVQPIWQIALAIWLMRGASFLMNLAFPNR